jgi:hypothetical protein
MSDGETHWIDQRIAQDKSIHVHAPSLYEAVWKRLSEDIDVAKQRGYNLETYQGPRGYEVRLFKRGDFNQTWVPDSALTFGLIGDRISAAGERVNLKFEVILPAGGEACLSFEGAPVSADKAAVLILDQLLFPRLQGHELNFLDGF